MIRLAKVVLINVAITVILLFLIEGFASILFIGRDVLRDEPTAERAHTEYDEELGWVNLPNVSIDDMYGPGIYLTTNSQRFRGSEDVSLEKNSDKTRIICSGDSFTLGYAVDDDHTWCRLLASMDAKLETVNLGQGGYGVDQAYLWYKRNAGLEHDIQIFAFITEDFLRMKGGTFSGYGKPFLGLRNGEIFQVNKPVPKRAYYAPALTTALGTLRELNTVQLLAKVARKVGIENDTSLDRGQPTEEIVSRIFADLQQVNDAKQSLLVLVYLPTRDDYMGFDPATSHWREFVHAEADKRGYILVDAVDELRSLPPDGIKDLFIGHFSNDGNRFIADVLHRELSKLSAMSSKRE
jgi:hypothetical protein